MIKLTGFNKTLWITNNDGRATRMFTFHHLTNQTDGWMRNFLLLSEVGYSASVASLLVWHLSWRGISPGVASLLAWHLSWRGISPDVASLLAWHLSWCDISPGVASLLAWHLSWRGIPPGFTIVKHQGQLYPYLNICTQDMCKW
jgi:hypothetical protein